MELQYFPFRDWRSEVAQQQAQAPAAPATRADHIQGVQVMPTSRGVLTCTLIRCINLHEGVDLYVRLQLEDPITKHTETVKSTVKINESNPRWDIKFDFVDVHAASTFSAGIVSHESGVLLSVPVPIVGSLAEKVQRTARDVVAWLIQDKGRLQGWVSVPVMECAANGILKDVWRLRGTDKGSIELKLEWNSINIDQAHTNLHGTNRTV